MKCTKNEMVKSEEKKENTVLGNFLRNRAIVSRVVRKIVLPLPEFSAVYIHIVNFRLKVSHHARVTQSVLYNGQNNSIVEYGLIVPSAQQPHPPLTHCEIVQL